MAFSDKTGIVVTSGFKLQAEAHLDARTLVANLTERDELVTVNAAVKGLIVYVEDEAKAYMYKGDSVWDPLTTATSEYTHPTGPGYNHIPTGGSTGQILVNTASGTAAWQDFPATADIKYPTTAQTDGDDAPEGSAAGDLVIDSNGTVFKVDDTLKLAKLGTVVPPETPLATDSNDGLLAKADYTKLQGIEAGANKYVLPTATDAVLGGVKQGAGVSIAADGTISTQNVKYGTTAETATAAILTFVAE